MPYADRIRYFGSMVNEISNAMAHALDMNATLVPLVDHWHYIDAHFCAARTLDCYFLRQTVCTAFPRAGVYGIPWECEDSACVGTALIYANGTAVYATTNFHWCDCDTKPTVGAAAKSRARTVASGPSRLRSRPRLSLCCDFAGFRAGLPPVPLSGAFRSALPRGAFDESADSAAAVGVYRIPHPEDFWYPLRHGNPADRNACVCLCAWPWLPQNLPRCSARPRCARPPPCTRALHRRGHRLQFQG
jgi:hypothetical protein